MLYNLQKLNKNKMNIDEQYLKILGDIKYEGTRKETRNGATHSLFGVTLTHDMKEGFPLLTTKKMYYTGIISELLWFLAGKTDLRTLLEEGNKIWVGDAFKNYLDYHKRIHTNRFEILNKKEFIQKILHDDNFSERWGDLGPIYGGQWLNWGSEFGHDNPYKGINQIKGAIKTLKNNPDSRRILVNAWNPNDIPDMILPPCHYSFQFWTRELTYEERLEIAYPEIADEDLGSQSHLDDVGAPKRALSLLWNQRSADFPLGAPFNIASYALLLELMAKEVNMVPEKLIGNIGDAHIYENQLEGVKEQITRDPYKYPYPKLKLQDGIRIADPNNEKFPVSGDIRIIGYQSYPSIKFPLSN